MPGAVYRIISGSDSSLTNQLATASLDGWLVFGSINQSGSIFSVLIGRGTGRIDYTPASNEMASSVSISSSFYSGINSIIYPPTSSIAINTNPNTISERT